MLLRRRESLPAERRGEHARERYIDTASKCFRLSDGLIGRVNHYDSAVCVCYSAIYIQMARI